MPRVILALASIAIAIYALADCASTEEERIKGLPKIVWVLLIVFIPWVGPLAWLLVGKNRSIPGESGLKREWRQAQEARAKKQAAQRPIAPDDDPEFLAQLERENRRRRMEAEKKQATNPDEQSQTPDGPRNKDAPEDNEREHGTEG